MTRREHKEELTNEFQDDGGRVLGQTQNTISASVPSVLSVDLSTYDRYGEQLFTALDVNHNGTIDFAGPDRVTGHSSAFITKNNAIWQEATQTVYPDFDSDRTVTTAMSRRKLTNLGAYAAVAETEDIRGNVTTTTQTVDPGTGHAFATTTVPTSIQPQVQVQRYGLLVESISTTAVTNRYAYDALNRRVASTDGRGNTTTTAYNALGQVAYVEDAATNRTTYVYDDYGRQIETVDALNQSTHTVYDLRGRVVRQYGATYPVWYKYDVEGRMTAMATTRDTTLDPATVDSLEDPSLDVTQWNYDPATGLLVQKLYDDLSAEQAGGKGPSYTYTPDGKLATRTWARGIVTSYAYDVLGSVLSVNYSDATPDVTYTYDRLGRQLSAITAGVSTNLYAYSTNTLELVSETQNGVVINRARDTYGRESGIALTSDYDVSYGYDTYGRFAAVSSAVGSASSVANYAYVPGARLVAGYTIGGLTRAVSYEPNRNLIASVTNAWNGALISSFDYVNDEIGRRTARTDNGSIANQFAYNVRSEVVSALMGTNTYGYVFDPIGNRIISTNNAEVTAYAANELNQYTAISNAVVALPAYDDDGNMTATGDGWHYVWNGENRLVIASNAIHVVSYAYDHQGRMVWKAVASPNSPPFKTIAYLWDGFNIVAETVAQDTATNTTYNVWGLDLDGTMQGAGGVGGLLAVVKDSATYIPAYDGNGNISEYVSADGTIAAHREYDPFGGSVVVTGNADDFTHWFSTKPWCAVTHLSEYEYRKYSPVLGRWLSRDPIGENGGKNLLVCCLNNIESYIDVLGLEMRRISVVFDFTSPDEGNWISRTFNEPSGKIFVKNTADVLNWLSDLDECTCIDTITISAHGAGAGRINLGDGLFDHGNLSYLEMNSDDLGPRGKEIRNQMELAMAVLSSIKERLCDNSTMYFLICKAGEGEGGTNLREWLEQFYTEDTDIVLFPGECAFIYGIPSASPWWAPKKTRRE